MGAQEELMGMMIRKLYQNQSLISGISKLHRGSYQARQTNNLDGSSVVDT